jgi:hypothetical protein
MDAIQAAAIFISTNSVELAVALGAAVGSAAGAAAIISYVFVQMPEDYLERQEIAPIWPDRPRWMRIAAKTGKNVLGVVVIASGVVLAIPGVVGPGTPLILAGLVITDIPGKQRLARRILGNFRVLGLVNRIRSRFGRRPLSVTVPRRSTR